MPPDRKAGDMVARGMQAGVSSGLGSVEYRRASESDLADEFAVFSAAQVELHARRGGLWDVAPFDPAGRWAQVHRHLLQQDGERSFVAESGGRVVGFTAALVRGDTWYLSALFVDPAFQGRGVGRKLLALAWSGSVRRRITITEAIQPVSTGLYASRGLLPVTPMLELWGRPTIEGIDRRLEATEPSPEALRLIDLAAYGFDRAVDHDFWGRTSSRARVWVEDGQPLAYSYFGLFGIGPVAGVDPENAACALRAEIAASAGADVRVGIPGSAPALVEVALEAGLRFTDPGLLLLSPPTEPPTALAVDSYWLL
jgi:GNAT superfamily N-acetyltransferase